MENVIIIGIIGSYGKTSTKHVLYNMFKDSTPTIATPGNTNTLLGVANFIIKEVQTNHKIIIIEMGEHYKGDIKDLCRLTTPKIIVLTGLTLQHSERMGNLNDIASVLFEFAEQKTIQHVVYNADDKDLSEAIRKHTNKIYAEIIPTNAIKDISYEKNFAGISFNYNNENLKARLLGKHASWFIMAALVIGKLCNLKNNNLTRQIPYIPYIEHRLQLIHNHISNIYVIDDSYNGNIEGVKATIDIVMHTPFDGKKIYITPGLMELGNNAVFIHKQIAKLLDMNFDLIILIDNANTRIMHTELLKNGYKKENIIVYPDRNSAHIALKNHTTPNSLVVFQNDIPSGF